MFSIYINEINDDEKVDAPTIKELLNTWETNNKARKSNELQLINDAVNAIMLPQIQEIQDRQENAFSRYQRNLIKIRKSHQK